MTNRLIETVYGANANAPDMNQKARFNRSKPNQPALGLEIPVIASTQEKTKEWIDDLMRNLGWTDEQKAYQALSAVMHALRDRLTTQKTAELSAQLPMLIRGMFFEGWTPSHAPLQDRSQELFLSQVRNQFPTESDVKVEEITKAVCSVMAKHISKDELNQILVVTPNSIYSVCTKVGI